LGAKFEGRRTGTHGLQHFGRYETQRCLTESSQKRILVTVLLAPTIVMKHAAFFGKIPVAWHWQKHWHVSSLQNKHICQDNFPLVMWGLGFEDPDRSKLVASGCWEWPTLTSIESIGDVAVER